MWSKPVALGLLAVAMYHGRGRGILCRASHRRRRRRRCHAGPATDVQTGSRASGTDGARCPGCAAAG